MTIFSTKGSTELIVHWLPHANNPAYAGVRLRCLIPQGTLAQQGHAMHIVQPGAALPRSGLMVVQAKWLLDAGDADALRRRTEALRDAGRHGVRMVLDSFDNYFLNQSGDPARASLLTAYREALGLFDAYSVSSPGLVPFMVSELPPGSVVQVVGDPIENVHSHHCYESWFRRAQPLRLPDAFGAWLHLFRHRYQRRQVRQLMWFGNHGTSYAQGGMIELQRIFPALASLAKTQALHLTIVSNSRTRYMEVFEGAQFSHNYRDWDRLHFLPLLAEQDLVLLPSRSNSFTAAKSNNRLLLALAQGVPVMADPLPDYLPWKDYCAVDEWENLVSYVVNPTPLALRAAQAAVQIDAAYSARAISAQWLTLFKSLS